MNPAPSLLFDNCTARWLQNAACNCSDATIAKYKQVIRLYLHPALGHLPVDQIDENTIQDLYDTLGRAGKNLSPATIHMTACILHQVFAELEHQGAVSYDPTRLAYTQRRNYANREMLPQKAIRALLEKRSENLYGNLFAFMLISMLPFGQCCALSVKDLDSSGRLIHITHRLVAFTDSGKSHTGLAEARGCAQRSILLPAIAFSYLEDELKRQRLCREMARANWSNPHQLIFTDSCGRPLQHYKVTRKFQRLMASYEIPNATLHSLRHTGATLFFSSCHDLPCLRHQLGISSVAAAGLYVHGCCGGTLQ